MEPLTHTLVGAALARTAPARDTALAGVTLMVAANLPDIDVLSYFSGADAASGFRRGWTHGPLALAVLPPLWILLLTGIDRFRRRRDPARPPLRTTRLLGLAYLGCLTHPLLDWLNTYGVRFLMPFDDRWFYGDAVFIVDPWLWLLLGGALYCTSERRGVPWGWLTLAFLTTLVVLVARSMLPVAVQAIWLIGLLAIVALRRGFPALHQRSARIAGLALALVLLYIGALVGTTRTGHAWVLGELQRRGIGDVSRLMVGPMPANPLRWDVVVETPAAYRHGELRWLPRRELSLDTRTIERHRPSPIIDAALAAPEIRGTLSWMRFPFVEVEEVADGYVVHVLDARYVRSRREGFGTIRVRLDRELRPRAP